MGGIGVVTLAAGTGSPSVGAVVSGGVGATFALL